MYKCIQIGEQILATISFARNLQLYIQNIYE